MQQDAGGHTEAGLCLTPGERGGHAPHWQGRLQHRGMQHAAPISVTPHRISSYLDYSISTSMLTKPRTEVSKQVHSTLHSRHATSESYSDRWSITTTTQLAPPRTLETNLKTHPHSHLRLPSSQASKLCLQAPKLPSLHIPSRTLPLTPYLHPPSPVAHLSLLTSHPHLPFPSTLPES